MKEKDKEKTSPVYPSQVLSYLRQAQRLFIGGVKLPEKVEIAHQELDEPWRGFHERLRDLIADIEAVQVDERADSGLPTMFSCHGGCDTMFPASTWNEAWEKGWRHDWRCEPCQQVEDAAIARAVAEGDQPEPVFEGSMCRDCGRTMWNIVGNLCDACRVLPYTDEEQAEIVRRGTIHGRWWADQGRRQRVRFNSPEAVAAREAKRQEEQEREARSVSTWDLMILPGEIECAIAECKKHRKTEPVRKYLRKALKLSPKVQYISPLATLRGAEDEDGRPYMVLEELRNDCGKKIARLRRFIAAFPREDVKNGDHKLLKFVDQIEADIMGEVDTLPVLSDLDWDEELKKMNGEQE